MKLNHVLTIVAAAAVSLLWFGCEDKTPAPTAPTSVPVPKQSSPPPSTPAPTPPAPAAPTVNGPNAAAVSAGGFSFTLPTGWRSVPPANQMRLAEVLVPDASGDVTKACSIVFSTAGGDVQGNIDRWAGQMKDSNGAPATPTVEKKTVAGVNVTVAEMSGSYAGMGEAAPHTGWTLRGAIVEGPAGMLFVKMTGPAEQMLAAKAGFASMIDGMKKQ